MTDSEKQLEFQRARIKQLEQWLGHLLDPEHNYNYEDTIKAIRRRSIYLSSPSWCIDGKIPDEWWEVR